MVDESWMIHKYWFYLIIPLIIVIIIGVVFHMSAGDVGKLIGELYVDGILVFLGYTIGKEFVMHRKEKK